MCAADCCRCLRRDPPPRRRAAAACARRRLVDDSSRARRAAQRAARLWSESSRVEITKSANFEVARESLEMVPRRSPGAGASRLSREGPVLVAQLRECEVCCVRFLLRSAHREPAQWGGLGWFSAP